VKLNIAPEKIFIPARELQGVEFVCIGRNGN